MEVPQIWDRICIENQYILVTKQALDSFLVYRSGKDKLRDSLSQLERALRNARLLSQRLDPMRFSPERLGVIVELWQLADLIFVIGAYNHEKILLAIEPADNVANHSFLIDFQNKPLLIGKGVLEEFLQSKKSDCIVSLKNDLNCAQRLTRNPLSDIQSDINQLQVIDYWVSPKGEWLFQIEPHDGYDTLLEAMHRPAPLKGKPFILTFQKQPLLVTAHAIRRFNERWRQEKEMETHVIDRFRGILSGTVPQANMEAVRVVKRLINNEFKEVTYWEHRRKKLRFVIADRGTYRVLFTVETIWTDLTNI